MSDTIQPDVFDRRYVKARKAHRCCECGDTIEVGHEHAVLSGLWDGEWARFRQCMSCDHEWQIVERRVDAGDGPSFGGLHDWIQENVGDLHEWDVKL